MTTRVRQSAFRSWWFALALLAVPGLCWGQTSDDQRARELYVNGTTLYQEGSYAEAVDAFKEAYELSKRPALLLNIANALERMGVEYREEVLDYLNRYRAFARPEERPTLQKRINNIERRILEDRAKELEELQKQLEQMRIDQQNQKPPPAPDPVYKPRMGLVLGGGGLAVVSGATAVTTFALSRTFRSGRQGQKEDDKARYEAIRPINNIALAGTGIGIGVAALGVILKKEVIPEPATEETSEQAFRLDIIPGPNGVMGSATWKF